MAKLIYVADDEKNIRDLIKCFLENEGYLVEIFGDGDSLVSAFRNKLADMIILDIMMPGTDGLKICSQLREEYNVPIIMVSARDSEADRIAGILVGSDDYLSKPFSPLELVARVNALFRRIELDKKPINENLLSFGDIKINCLNKTVTVKDCVIDLTPTEFALISYFVSNNDRAISRKELLKNVWKFDFEVDTRATDDVVKRLRKKIKDSNVSITAVWGFGFKIEVKEEK